MAETSQPSQLSGAYANIPRDQEVPRWPTQPLYPRERLPKDWGEIPEWRFEYRRNMQEILPNVFLGPLSIARHNSILHANGITMLVPVRLATTARFLQVPLDDNGKPWNAFPVDITNSQMMGWFYKTYLAVNEEIAAGGKVFIYCESGNGLSAAICVGLVMDTKGWNYLISREFVQRKRYSIDIPEWARFQLDQYEPMRDARKQISNTDDSTRASRRRNLDEVYEEELRDGEYMLGLPHWDHPRGREAVPPFSEADPNQMSDEEKTIEIGYPREEDDEDEVMMDFVSGR